MEMVGVFVAAYHVDPFATNMSVDRFFRMVDLAPVVCARLNGQPTKEFHEALQLEQMERRLDTDLLYPALSGVTDEPPPENG